MNAEFGITHIIIICREIMENILIKWYFYIDILRIYLPRYIFKHFRLKNIK